MSSCPCLSRLVSVPRYQYLWSHHIVPHTVSRDTELVIPIHLILLPLRLVTQHCVWKMWQDEANPRTFTCGSPLETSKVQPPRGTISEGRQGEVWEGAYGFCTNCSILQYRNFH